MFYLRKMITKKINYILHIFFLSLVVVSSISFGNKSKPWEVSSSCKQSFIYVPYHIIKSIVAVISQLFLAVLSVSFEFSQTLQGTISASMHPLSTSFFKWQVFDTFYSTRDLSINKVCYCVDVLLETEVDSLLGHIRTEGTSPAGCLMASFMSADVYI